MLKRADRIKASVDRILWNDTLGVFMASSALEHDRVDIWANAMAGAIGFASENQSRAIFEFFDSNKDDIFFEGQVVDGPPTLLINPHIHLRSHL